MHGHVLLSGIQALVRALLTRRCLDRAQGLDSGGFVSGYRGSPLGGLDKELWSYEGLLKDAGIVFQPGINEELAATAVWGTQHVGLRPGATVAGTFGLWYGKAPGLDRSCDAIRHANAAGTSPNGGVLLVVGDDPAAKSSSLATQSEHALAAMGVPILAPSDVQDVHDFAVLGWALSRHSGCWIALKAIADHMDSAGIVDVSERRLPNGMPLEPVRDVHVRLTDNPLDQEERLLERKLPAALEAARAAGINRWLTRGEPGTRPGRLGIVTSGQAYADLREALRLLGLETRADIRAHGIDILKLGMVWPLDRDLLAQFAGSVDEVFVLEDKRPFLEQHVKAALYGATQAPIHGKRDHSGRRLLPEHGCLSVANVARVLVALTTLEATAFLRAVEENEARLKHVDAKARDERTPLFCAGCPHNTSTRVPQGSRAVAGIGCHYMVQWMDRDTNTFTQMGGEGVTWLGEAPFTDEAHIFANLGDGTYFHSGILAIRQAVASDANMTYKLLFNDAVAMTGGQPMDGALAVATLVEQLKAEGVAHVCVVSDAPSAHVGLPDDVPVYDRDRLDAVQRTLRDMPGVTVLIYQQACATELRRKRKRGMVADAKPRLVINPAVCDGCGDCSVQSGCVAVEPVETAVGTKRRINQTMCNRDLSCAKGYCPAFVEVAGELAPPQDPMHDVATLRRLAPAPARFAERANIVVTGVGGTGIVTLGAVLAVAAKIDGRGVSTLDMTGLAQKGGAVFSHIRIAGPSETLHTARVAPAQSDVLIACDLVTAATNEALSLLGSRTLACVNTHIAPTADFVLHQESDAHLQQRLGRVRRMAGTLKTVASAEHVERSLGDTAQANVFLLGFAYQSGRIPIGLRSIERALEINGVAVERNLVAFHLGRLAFEDAGGGVRGGKNERGGEAKGSLADEVIAAVPWAERRPAHLDDLIAMHERHLNDYDGPRLSERYATLVGKVSRRERALRPGAEILTRAVADSYAKLLAVKDEYEVARLHLSEAFRGELARQFDRPKSVRYLLAPPLLGGKKRRFGSWITGVFRLLVACRFLRNTPFDPFRQTSERKRARWLIEHYEAVVAELLSGLTLENHAIAVEIAKLPMSMRGFGHVKVQQTQAGLAREAALLEAFHGAPTPVRIIDPRRDEAA
jgi:indolepyruvate ferredoxin oxidoreductase